MKLTPVYDLTGKRIWVAGHTGMVGSAVCRRLEREDCEVIIAGRETVNLLRQTEVENWLSDVRPDAVIMAAAKVGGIGGNETFPADFIYQNMMIETNIIHSSYLAGVEKLLFLGSSCIYPKMAPQPLGEGSLLTGALEPTNEYYAVAKIAGVKLCQAYRKQYDCDFISAMPTNLYGPGDTFDLKYGHVAPTLMVKMHQAKLAGDTEIEIWGTGKPKREFLYVDDLADGLVHLMQYYSEGELINIGSNEEVSIRELVEIVAKVVNYQGSFYYNTARPDGAPRKRLDSTRMYNLGWRPTTTMPDGMKCAYEWFLEDGHI